MRRSSLVLITGAFILTGALQGCSKKSRQAAEAATQEFRERYSRSEFEQIYAASAPELWTQVTHDDFLQIMRGATGKLGGYRSSTATGWKVYAGTNGTAVTLGFQTVFEKGKGDEVFVWRVDDSSAKLAGYHINSMAFLAE
jgi:hypothetical protein